MVFTGGDLEKEADIILERFAFAQEFWVRTFKDREKFENFKNAYMDCLARQNTVLFYNRFMVKGFK
jgi:hypothetical protein